jgi:hypothetical protein
VYALVTGEVVQLAAELSGGRLTVSVPEDRAREWTSTDKIGMEDDVTLAEGLTLHILIEKDFKGLSRRRRREDESDAYPNPRLQV